MSSRITINGKTIDIQGDASCVVIRDGVVTVGGKQVVDGLQGVVRVQWEGPLTRLDSDASVECREVQGDITAGGSVRVTGGIGGSVNAGGSVNCGPIGGSANAGGSVHVGR